MYSPVRWNVSSHLIPPAAPPHEASNRGALLPFGDGFRVDPEALGHRPQALLTMLVL
jgi:hypothetical protein